MARIAKTASILCLMWALLLGLEVEALATEKEIGCSWRTYELHEAVSTGVADVIIMGTGGYAGDCIEITVKPTVDVNLKIRVEPGTVLLSTVSTEQDMVVRRVKWKITAELTLEPALDIEVKCGGTETYVLEAYCLDLSKKAPSSSTQFRLGGASVRTVADVIAVLPRYEDADRYDIQDAIWVATGDVDESEVTGVPREIIEYAKQFRDEEEQGNVMSLLLLVLAIVLLSVLALGLDL